MGAHLSFGFGTVVGTIWKNPGIGGLDVKGDGWIWVVPSVSTLKRSDVPPGVCAILTAERLSVYSHAASDVWRLEVPVLAGVDTAQLESGSCIFVDFNSTEYRPCHS